MGFCVQIIDLYFVSEHVCELVDHEVGNVGPCEDCCQLYNCAHHIHLFGTPWAWVGHLAHGATLSRHTFGRRLQLSFSYHSKT